MSRNSTPSTIATIGIDLGKNTFHLVGLDQRGAIVLQLELSRGQLERRLANVPRAAVSIIRNLPRSGEYVVAGNDPASPRQDLKRPWVAIERRAQLTGVRLHDLRHSFASVGAGAGLGLPIIGKLLGHAQAQTTQRCAHLDTDPVKRSVEFIADYMASAMGDLRSLIEA